MRLTGHQPNYLPYPGFFQKLMHADAFVIVDNVQFVKRGPFGWIHRNRIRTPSGWEWLTIPVLTKGKFGQMIMDVRPNNSMPWGRKHWRTIEWHYRKAPYFSTYGDAFCSLLTRPWGKLIDLNIAIIERVMAFLDIDIPVYRCSELGIHEKSSRLVLAMCQKLDADTYLSGIHGKDYLDLSIFEKEAVQIEFQDFQLRDYAQVYGPPFVPNLSILDLLMNCGPDSRDWMKQ